MNILQVIQSVSLGTAALVFSSVLFLYLLSKKNQNHLLPPSPPSLPIIGHLHHLGPLIHQSLHNLSERYGPLIHIRIGSVPCVVASTSDLARDFLKSNKLAFSSRKHLTAINHISYGLSFVKSPYGPYWKFINKMSTAELLGSKSLAHFLSIRTQEFHELLQTLIAKSKLKESVNLTEELLKLTNNVICQMMMSVRCSGTRSEANEARNLVRAATNISGEFNVTDFIWFCKNLDLQGFKKRYEDIHRRWDTLLEKIVFEREEKRREGMKSANTKRNDFLDMLLDVSEDDKADTKITRDNIKGLLLEYCTAATDTTAIALEWTLVELINNPEVLEKARKEISHVIGNDRLVHETDAPNLPYIQAIIKETLRLHPSIPLLNRMLTENMTVQGYDIPAGTMLYVNIWSIGRDPKYWENPLEFNPNRFLEGDALNSSLDFKGQSFQFLPFGFGRRGCPGINLAMRELLMVIAGLIQCFDWNSNDKVFNMDERGGFTNPTATDFVCIPSVRQDCPKVLFQP